MRTNKTKLSQKMLSCGLALSMVMALAVSAFAAGIALAPDPDAVLAAEGNAKIEMVAAEELTLAGAKVTVTYETDKLTPTAVTLSDAFGEALMVNNIENEPNGALVVVFAQAGDAVIAADTAMFSVTFAVLGAEGDATDVLIHVDESANAALEDVTIPTSGDATTYTIVEPSKLIELEDDADSGDITLNREDDDATTATLTNISPSFSLSDILELLTSEVTSLQVVAAADDTVVTRTAAATGDRVQLLDAANEVVDEVVLVVKGDTNGDANTDSGDILIVQRNILKTELLNGVYLEAGTIDGNVADSNVVLALQKHILKFDLL